MEADDYQFEGDGRQSKKVRFDKTVNLGHVMTGVMMAAALVTMWADNKVDKAESGSRIAALEKSSVEMKSTMDKLADNAAGQQRTQDKLSLTLEYLAKQIPQRP